MRMCYGIGYTLNEYDEVCTNSILLTNIKQNTIRNVMEDAEHYYERTT